MFPTANLNYSLPRPARFALAAGLASMLLASLPAQASIPQPPTTNRMTITWLAPYKGDSNLSYNIYGSSDLRAPVVGWPLLASVPWPSTSATLTSTANASYFVVTVSNYWGEAALSPIQSAPGKKNVTLAWDYETTTDQNLIFKLYHATDATIPMTSWPVITNVPGSARSLTLALNPGTHIFSLTASNLLGESDYSNTATTPPAPTKPGGVKIQQ